MPNQPRRPPTTQQPRPASPLLGHEVETVVERIVPGGVGLAHAEGWTIFVPLTAPGDRVRARIERVQHGVAHATIVEVLEPGSDRVDPPFPAVTRCGGADFQHLTYEAQLAAKVAIVRDCLRRVGGVEPPEDLPIIPSPRQWGYRSRAEWHHDPAQPALGYLARASHDVCDLDRDPMVVPALAELFADLRDRLRGGTLPPDAVEFRAAATHDGISLSPPLDGGTPATIVQEVAGERLAYDADCFFQANPELLPPLVAEALRFAPEPGQAEPAGSDLAIDLFCGVGLFTLPLARRFGRVIGVEAHERTAAFALSNAAEAGLRHVRIEAAPVERWLATAYRSHGRPPFLLLDPPRTGLAPAALAGIARLRPGRIAYVSCDPATLARDLRSLIAAGFALTGVIALDLLPQTHHVEVVAHLVRRDQR